MPLSVIFSASSEYIPHTRAMVSISLILQWCQSELSISSNLLLNIHDDFDDFDEILHIYIYSQFNNYGMYAPAWLQHQQSLTDSSYFRRSILVHYYP